MNNMILHDLLCYFVTMPKLEIMKVTTATNHFAIKYKLLVAANIASMNELVNLRKNNAFA